MPKHQPKVVNENAQAELTKGGNQVSLPLETKMATV